MPLVMSGLVHSISSHLSLSAPLIEASPSEVLPLLVVRRESGVAIVSEAILDEVDPVRDCQH
jgi:hypothetical protein